MNANKKWPDWAKVAVLTSAIAVVTILIIFVTLLALNAFNASAENVVAEDFSPPFIPPEDITPEEPETPDDTENIENTEDIIPEYTPNPVSTPSPTPAPTPEPTPMPAIDFTPVSYITDIPASVTAGISIDLIGTVQPINATFKDIIWNVYEPGDTGATTSGSVLTAAAPGNIVLRATIANGASQAPPAHFIQDFFLAVTLDCVPPMGIAGVPTYWPAAAPLPLPLTVIPENAAYSRVSWSLRSVGTTGATLIAHTLRTLTPGVVGVRATVECKTGSIFTFDINITITDVIPFADEDDKPYT